jgi:hypothetical protein
VEKIISSAGDINGDGFDDVIISSHKFDVGEFTDAGKAFVFFGSSSGLSSTPDWTFSGDQSTAYLSGAVSSAGDINGDGFNDVIIGADSYDVGEFTNAGKAFVFFGSSLVFLQHQIGHFLEIILINTQV